MSKILERALEAHGGLDRWNRYKAIEADVASTGELLEHKVGRAGDVMHATAQTQGQVSYVGPIADSGKRMTYSHDRVAVETYGGETLLERYVPRSAFHGHEFETPWDVLHRAYFSNYALWSYLTTPFSFAAEGTQVWEIDPLEEAGEEWQGIRVVLPSTYATHSRAQEFYFGDDGLLRRQDYTLDIAGGEKVANYALDILDVDGIKVASKRRAYLCDKHYAVLPDRLIMSLDFSNFHVVT